MSRMRKTRWWKHPEGYIQGRIWDNNERRVVLQHRYVMEQHLGRRLLSNEDVHHKDGNRSNNDLENLVLLNHARHTITTNQTRQRAVRGIHFHIHSKKWYGQIKRNKQRFLTHYYATPNEARIAYIALVQTVEGREVPA